MRSDTLHSIYILLSHTAEIFRRQLHCDMTTDNVPTTSILIFPFLSNVSASSTLINEKIILIRNVEPELWVCGYTTVTTVSATIPAVFNRNYAFGLKTSNLPIGVLGGCFI